MNTANSIGFGVCLALMPFMVWQFISWVVSKLPDISRAPIYFGSYSTAIKLHADILVVKSDG